MKRKRHGQEEIIRKLREGEALEASRQTVGQVCQKLEVSEATLHRWRKQYRGMGDDDIRPRTSSAPLLDALFDHTRTIHDIALEFDVSIAALQVPLPSRPDTPVRPKSRHLPPRPRPPRALHDRLIPYPPTIPYLAFRPTSNFRLPTSDF